MGGFCRNGPWLVVIREPVRPLGEYYGQRLADSEIWKLLHRGSWSSEENLPLGLDGWGPESCLGFFRGFSIPRKRTPLPKIVATSNYVHHRF